MASLTKDEIVHVAKLANLKLSDDEVAKFTPQLSKVIDYISDLSKVDTEKTNPTSQTTGLENVMRADEIKSEQSLTQDEALSGTDSTYNGYFKVKAILEGRTDK